eukprot:TRINITY_DN12114_c0_g2_i1.p1 TRINITY_DN12114_c0_g2~~TRINITY_DN12114_c0_g2_i1.p1  ORF type:complete len:844 (+),score=264.12 TRINITY_DN12114_c0_g2_i1:47-2533(+)
MPLALEIHTQRPEPPPKRFRIENTSCGAAFVAAARDAALGASARSETSVRAMAAQLGPQFLLQMLTGGDVAARVVSLVLLEDVVQSGSGQTCSSLLRALVHAAYSGSECDSRKAAVVLWKAVAKAWDQPEARQVAHGVVSDLAGGADAAVGAMRTLSSLLGMPDQRGDTRRCSQALLDGTLAGALRLLHDDRFAAHALPLAVAALEAAEASPTFLSLPAPCRVGDVQRLWWLFAAAPESGSSAGDCLRCVALLTRSPIHGRVAKERCKQTNAAAVLALLQRPPPALVPGNDCSVAAFCDIVTSLPLRHPPQLTAPLLHFTVACVARPRCALPLLRYWVLQVRRHEVHPLTLSCAAEVVQCFIRATLAACSHGGADEWDGPAREAFGGLASSMPARAIPMLQAAAYETFAAWEAARSAAAAAPAVGALGLMAAAAPGMPDRRALIAPVLQLWRVALTHREAQSVWAVGGQQASLDSVLLAVIEFVTAIREAPPRSGDDSSFPGMWMCSIDEGRAIVALTLETLSRSQGSVAQAAVLLFFDLATGVPIVARFEAARAAVRDHCALAPASLKLRRTWYAALTSLCFQEKGTDAGASFRRFAAPLSQRGAGVAAELVHPDYWLRDISGVLAACVTVPLHRVFTAWFLGDCSSAAESPCSIVRQVASRHPVESKAVAWCLRLLTELLTPFPESPLRCPDEGGRLAFQRHSPHALQAAGLSTEVVCAVAERLLTRLRGDGRVDEHAVCRTFGRAALALAAAVESGVVSPTMPGAARAADLLHLAADELNGVLPAYPKCAVRAKRFVSAWQDRGNAGARSDAAPRATGRALTEAG